MSLDSPKLRLRKAGKPETPATGETWKILIVDDDPYVHDLTHLVLDTLVVEGHRLELLSCYSYREAQQLLEQERNIALALVDVVMDTDDAGLRLVRYIRKELDNSHTRIVLRTGQPGQAPEDRIIRDYDINDYREKTELTAKKLVTLVYSALRAYRDILEVTRLRDRFDALAHLDALTGIPNRRSFDEALIREWQRCQRSGHSLGLLLADVDFFKRYNDHYGHKAGDEVLRRVAQALTAALHRPGDLAARYGGEEFICILPETDASGARHIAARLHAMVSALDIPHEDSPAAAHITISIGVATAIPDRIGSAQRLVELADRRLYAAKRTGRNQVVADGEEEGKSGSATDSDPPPSPNHPTSGEAGATGDLATMIREAQRILRSLGPVSRELSDCLDRLEQTILSSRVQPPATSPE